MEIRRNHWAARVSILALLVAVCTVPQIRSSEGINRCQALETIAFSSYSGTVGGAQLALNNYESCLIQQYGSPKASLVPCAAYLKIASAFFVLSSSSRYLSKALVDYTWCVTGEKSIYESTALTSCDAYLDVVRIAVSAGDIALASFATNASRDCQTRTLLSTQIAPPTPSKSPIPSPNPTPTALPEMPPPPLPSVNGEVQIGKTITLVWSTPISGYDSVTYKWLQLCNASNNCRGSFEIFGANQSSYTIQSKDAGFGISVNILYKKVGFKDYERSVQVSSSVSALTQSPTPKPKQVLNISAPSSAVVSGDPIVGGFLTIEYSGTWMSEVNLSYQWMRRCILIACPWKTNTIAGATSSTYSPTIQDKGQQIYVVITAKKEGYFNKSIESDWPGPKILGAPEISGILQEGRTLIGYEGSWESGYTFTYRWEVTCKNASPPLNSCYKVIPSASSKTFKITSAQTGKAIRFIVIGMKQGNVKVESYSRDYGEIVNYSHRSPKFLPGPQQPTPTPKPSVITQPSFVPPPTTPGVDCNSNPSPLCGGSGALPSPPPAPAPTLIASPAPTLMASPLPAPTQTATFVEVLCLETYPASNNPKTPVTATIATRVIESLVNSQICPEGMTRKINEKPVFAEAGIFLSSDKTQINYSPAKDNSAGFGNRLERFFACNTQASISPKRLDIPKTTMTISRTLGDDELNCPKSSTFVATVFYYGYKTIKGKGYGGLAGQWPSWTDFSRPTKQKTSFEGKCDFNGQVGFWERSETHLLVCRPNAKSGKLTWTQ